MNWKKIRDNSVLEGDETFFISFNPHAQDEGNPDKGETALVRKFKTTLSKYYILRGDFREDYEAIVSQGYQACKRFFDNKASVEGRGFWSN